MAMVFWLDHWTNLPAVQHLYYFPIVFAAIALGIAGGVSPAATATLLYHFANPRFLSHRVAEQQRVDCIVAGRYTARRRARACS